MSTNAIPVLSLEESADIEHFGVRGIVVTKAQHALLKKTIGDSKAVRERLATEVVKVYSISQLTNAQRTSLYNNLDLMTNALKLTNSLLKRVDVVDFRSATLQGMAKDGRILIARKMLDDANESLTVLIHEFAHDNGSDGDKGHVATIERFWCDVVTYLRKGNA